MAQLDEDPSEAKWELINDEQSARLARQEQSLVRIESKAAFVAGFAVAAGQFLATRHPFATPLSTLFGLLAFLGYLLAGVSTVWGTRVARGSDIDQADLLVDAQDPARNKAHVLQRLISTKAALYEEGARMNTRRARTWRLSVAFLSAGLLSSLAASC